MTGYFSRINGRLRLLVLERGQHYRIQRKTIIFVILTHSMEKVFEIGMQEERKSCCRIKHLNPFKSIFLLWIGTFAARGMYVRVGTIGSHFLPSCNLPQEKVCYLKMGTHFVVSPFHSLTMRLLKHLTFRHKYTKINEMQLHKRLDSIL